ncbi:cholesterol 7-desaturase nvd 1-like [Dermacentor silvarum]|uniref:cholesterol 7-desaturase nvd 1-like n=1 Tax=Dermacentor silvarum TaxID=543639 RepID=UPI0021007A7E|nr:cholesterol 7-desaturase nvd 1-like [Dermacentor silvarum]
MSTGVSDSKLCGSAASLVSYFIAYCTNMKHRRSTPRYISPALPPVFPNGWVPLLESTDLRVNEVKPLTAIGQDFVVFRTADGVAHVLDAYCPHLGAHLGVMGRVVGDCVECPFHGWRFQGETGACTHVPYASKAPTFLKIKTWTCQEKYGLIFMWYHAEGEEPEWSIDDYAELSSGAFRQMTRYETRSEGHVQDIAENVADTAHLNHVHEASWLLSAEEYAREAVTAGSWKSRFMSVTWQASWSPKHFSANAPFTFDMSLFGWKPRLLQCRGVISQCGPYLAVVHTESAFGCFVSVMSTTPEGPFQQRIIHRTFARPSTFSWMVCVTMERGFANMLERDFLIMGRKTVLKNPALVKEESGVPAFRRWYDQFYTSNSPTWQDVKERTLEW